MKAAAVVIGVVSTGFVNVTSGGTTIPNVPYPSWYSPQAGDAVIIDYLGHQPYVDTCLTPGRLVLSGVTVVNSAPGTGWDQISTVYSKTGVSTNPALTLVRTTAPPAGPSTLTVNSSLSGEYDPANGWNNGNHKPRQGSFGSGGCYGLWCYGTSAFSALSGHTVTGVTMTIYRDTSAGRTFGPMQLHLYLHSYTAPPTSGSAPTLGLGPLDASGANPSLGAGVSFSLPITWGQALQAGTSAGIGIYSPNSSDYVVCLGPDSQSTSGQLAITYT